MKKINTISIVFISSLLLLSSNVYSQVTVKDLNLKGSVRSVSEPKGYVFIADPNAHSGYSKEDGSFSSVLYFTPKIISKELYGRLECESIYFDPSGNICNIGNGKLKYNYENDKLTNIIWPNGKIVASLSYDENGKVSDFYHIYPSGSQYHHYKFLPSGEVTDIYNASTSEKLAFIKNGKLWIKNEDDEFIMTHYPVEPLRYDVEDALPYSEYRLERYIEDSDTPTVKYLVKVSDGKTIKETIYYNDYGLIEKYDEYEYKYKYDSNGNWISCTKVNKLGIPQNCVERRITYWD